MRCTGARRLSTLRSRRLRRELWRLSGGEWSCGDERICIYTPQCEGKFCGGILWRTLRPSLESGAGESFLAQGLSDCPEAILCSEGFGVCRTASFLWVGLGATLSSQMD